VDGSENRAHHSEQMNELEKRLEAITNRSNLKEARIVRPCTAVWDAAPYPSKFKAPTLHTFDGKRSPNQYILFQISNWKCSIKRCNYGSFVHWHSQGDSLWFMKLPTGSIKIWTDLF